MFSECVRGLLSAVNSSLAVLDLILKQVFWVSVHGLLSTVICSLAVLDLKLVIFCHRCSRQLFMVNCLLLFVL